MISLENTVLGNLLQDENYTRKVIPYLRPEYFDDAAAPEIRVCYELITDYFNTYNVLPTAEALGVELTGRTNLSERTFKAAASYLEELFAYRRGDTSEDWLIETSEKFCKRKAIDYGVKLTLMINSGEMKNLTTADIPKIWQDALSVSFNDHVGHDYLGDAEQRIKAYHSKEVRLPFDLERMNHITRGGLPKKSLSCVMGSTGAGKTAVLNHWAASHFSMGKNVLYITLEMGESVPGIAERIDANLLDTRLDELELFTEEDFMHRIGLLSNKTNGRMIIKEYPTSTAHVGHFRRLLRDLKTKQNFVPDIVYLDYINLCASTRIRMGNQFNSYTYVKYIAEEVRGLAVEFDVPIVTATQTNRGGYNTSDFDLEATSESIGLPATLDFFIALLTDKILEAKGQLKIKQLKNRWRQITDPRKFIVGFDRSRMRLYNLEDWAQDGVDDDDFEPPPEQKKSPKAMLAPTNKFAGFL